MVGSTMRSMLATAIRSRLRSSYIDVAHEFQQQIITVPKAAKVEGLAGGNDAVDAAPLQLPGKIRQLVLVEAEVSHGLVAAIHKRDNFKQVSDAVLKEQSAAAVFAA